MENLRETAPYLCSFFYNILTKYLNTYHHLRASWPGERFVAVIVEYLVYLSTVHDRAVTNVCFFLLVR